MFKWSIFALISLTLYSCQSNELIIPLAKDYFRFDREKALVLCQIDLTPFQDLSGYSRIKIEFEDVVEWEFVEVPNSLSAAKSYPIRYNEQIFDLYFTNFPMIHITGIPEKTNSTASLSYVQDTTIIQSNIRIKYRGKTTLKYPKKNFDIEFRIDDEGEKTQDFTLGNLRKDDDWILDAIYNEPLRINAYLAHKLWLKIHTLHYQTKEPKAKAGADVSYVEVFLNKSYQGVHMLSEQVDRKQLRIKKAKDKKIRGELIKGKNYGQSILFRGVRSLPNNESPTWDGYELKYPKPADIIDWSSLYELTDFVLNSNDKTFKAVADEYFHLDNAIDYFIFINVTGAMDNMAKNIYTARYDSNTPYFYIPWDLDATWGFNWQGLRHDQKNKIYSNGLFSRLIQKNPANFRQRLVQRWQDLRTTILAEDALIHDLKTAYQLMIANNVYEKEMAAWPKYQLEGDERKYMLNSIKERLQFLDNHFNKYATSK